jgi:hypothetical protein
MRNKKSYEIEALLGPHPGDDPVKRLLHTLKTYAATPDDEWAVRATYNIYGDKEQTGLTYGDLRRIMDILDNSRQR